MKTLALIAATLFNLFVFGSVRAHGDVKAEHGGDVGRGSDEIMVEFVMEKGTLNVYVHDDAGKPLPTNVTGTLIVVSPHRPAEEVQLVRASAHRFKAPGVKPTPGDRLRARVKLPSGEQYESVALFSDRKKPGHSHSHSDLASSQSDGAQATRTRPGNAATSP